MSTAATSLVATPAKVAGNIVSRSSKLSTPDVNIPPSPGTFRHPRLTEIIKRQSAGSITSQKIQNASINIVAIVVTFILSHVLEKVIGNALTLASIPPSAIDAPTVILLLRLLFIANICFCLRPILPYVSVRDNITDIALTPSQRALLGLPPSVQSSPATAVGGPNYVTPPRYRRDGGANTPASLQNSPLAFSTGRRSVSANYSSSPVSASRNIYGDSASSKQTQNLSAQAYRRTSDSVFASSPSGSPLLHKGVSSDLKESTFSSTGGRASLGTSTSSYNLGFNRPQGFKERHMGYESLDRLPSTPSPNGSRRPPGMNYKWLYDKGARLPRRESTGF